MCKYVSLHGNITVYEEDAYKYAMERISQDEDLEREFKEMVVEWFYSANWVHKDGEKADT